MVVFDKHRRTLMREEYNYQLQEVAEPNLYRDIYSYEMPPLMCFNHRVSPLMPAEDIWITDTTFRDGQQALPPFTVAQIVKLYELMHKMSGPNGIIRQSEFFLYTDKDKEAVQKCLEKGYEFPEVTGWIRAKKEDLKLVKEMGLRETGILTSASDYHIFNKLKMTRKQAMESYLGIVREALEIGIIPRCHFEDITRADFYGFVVPFAQELMRLSRESGIPVKIRACDTLGYGVSVAGVMLPRNVNGIVYGLHKYAGVPSELMEWHGHNDFYRALTNSVAAWLYGCSAVNGTLLGIGERTGNTPIEALLIEYIGLRGELAEMDTSVITEVAVYFEKEIGYKVPANQPLVGANFNVTRAGIHADGLMKDQEIYNIFDTEKVLNRPVDIGITDKSGVAGIAYWINSRLKIPEKFKVEKNDPGVVAIKEWVDEEYKNGRVTGISDEEMWEQARIHFSEWVGYLHHGSR
ncbi:2-isopropylmalate synthase [candidate division FCPU426 bacterium]|nr:2-isopropylmalate synthase [candidate division FCPU426 bacterium]